MDTISERIYKEIQEKKIEPRPRWTFLLRRGVIWTLFGATVIIGGISVSVLIFLVIDFDWEAHRYLHPGLWESVLLGLPYFWLLVIGTFIGVAYYNFRHTNTGYRYHTYTIVAVSIATSVVVGGVSYVLGAGEELDAMFEEKLPYYRVFVIHREDMWANPERGLLGGVVRRVIVANSELELEDFSGRVWLVDYDDADIRDITMVEEGVLIKVFGEQPGEALMFIAHEICPWDGKRIPLPRPVMNE